jgi:hypothetical protein
MTLSVNASPRLSRSGHNQLKSNLDFGLLRLLVFVREQRNMFCVLCNMFYAITFCQTSRRWLSEEGVI